MAEMSTALRRDEFNLPSLPLAGCWCCRWPLGDGFGLSESLESLQTARKHFQRAGPAHCACPPILPVCTGCESRRQRSRFHTTGSG
jgi:hypothetical protein